MDNEHSYIALVENAARARKDDAIPREYVVDALRQIRRGEVEVKKYPSGWPSLKDAYLVAKGLYEKGE